MLKKISLLTAIVCLAVSVYAQKIRISADLSGLQDSATAKIGYHIGKVVKADMVTIKNGKFEWEAEMPQPQQIVVILLPIGKVLTFYGESGNIGITGNANFPEAIKVTGSKTQDEYVAFKNSIADLDKQDEPLYGKYGKVSKEEQLVLEQKIDAIRLVRTERTNQYIKAHPKSALSVGLIYNRLYSGNYTALKASYNLLDKSAQQSPDGKLINESLIVIKRSMAGEMMLNFTQNDPEGKAIHFSDFKGKYVLIDFWASWCGPCRTENPNVLKAYNRYKDRNFTVIGISLDDKAALWKKAIADDGMPWAELSDLKGWKNELSTYYGIHGIPSTLLIDPQGKIIAKDLRGEMLNKKLAELFN